MVLLDSIGMVTGYFLGPTLGISALYGVIGGLVITKLLFVIWLGTEIAS